MNIAKYLTPAIAGPPQPSAKMRTVLAPLTRAIQARIQRGLAPDERRGVLVDTWTQVGGRPVFAWMSWDVPAEGALPVVLVHGLVVSGLYMAPTALRLAPYRRVYVPDLPGFGKSWKPRTVLGIAALADALRDWMDAAGLERALLVGNSMGCQIAVDLAVRQPERVAGLVLVGPTMDPRDRSMVGEAARLLRAFLREPPLLDWIELRDGLLFGLRRLLRTTTYALNDPIQAKLPLVRQPTLVLRGAHDPIVPPDWATEAARLLPQGRFMRVPDATHAINLDAPARLSRVVRAFARMVERAERAAYAPTRATEAAHQPFQ